MGKEIHLLGYGFNLADGPLNKHLNLTQKLRKERVTLQLAVINRFFGRTVVDLNKILYPSPRGTNKSDSPRSANDLSCRDTLMKPHLVHALLSQGLFSEYRAAAYWVAQNAQVPVQVPKLPIAAAIAMIVAAGGEAVLAHPGYIACESEVKLDSLLAELVPLGLRGLEVDYPYLGTSPAFADAAGEKKLIANMRRLAKRFKLKETRGSDAHDIEALKRFSSKC
ncbi:MAG: hypothetical protein NTZ12_10480, partial [Candidatus Aminicenantes bacterium]|nr:hypothetical protein [Candidatus Aminicenantes bacterium]